MPGKNQQGFLLIEIVMATFIISVALVAVAGLFSHALRTNTMANTYTMAANIAQQKLEEIKEDIEQQKSPFWNDIESYPYTQTETMINTFNFTLTTQADVYGDRTKGDADPNNKIVMVTTTVAWNAQGSEHTVQVTTYCLRNTLYSVYPKR